MKPSLYELDQFQLDNLLYNRVPFKLMTLRESLTPYFSGLQLMHLKTCEVVLSSPEDILDYVSKENLTKDHALVIVGNDSAEGEMIQKKMMASGYINVFFIKDGVASLQVQGVRT